MILLQTSDEVDFTVLAASSVLGDLTHKCPPAEACREAFERMSKATVQMALSTTGFGSPVDLTCHFARANAPQPGGRARYGRYQQRQQMGKGPIVSRRQIQMQTQTQTRESRPIPRFDMNLEGLLGDSDNEGHTRTLSSGHMARERRYSDLSAPEQSSRAHHRRPSMKYGHALPQQQQYYYTNTSAQDPSSPDNITITPNNPPFPVTADQDNQLDFLDFASTGSDGLPLGYDKGYADDDVIMPSLGHGVGHSVGIDLGFGMAVDFQHDWSENANYDMLEGYFFGGGGFSAE